MTMLRTRVLSIVGPNRSGTTLVGNVLGEVEGIANAGELRWLWRRGIAERRPCGCGLPPVECPVWSVVLQRIQEARERWSGNDGDLMENVGTILRAQGEVLARRNRLRVLSSARGQDTSWEALRRMRAATAEVSRARAETTGAQLVVDTSKLPHVAALHAGADGIEHYVLYMVRDPRAVAFSWQRRKALPVSAGTATMATQGPVASVGFWMESCLGAELLRRHVPRHRWLFMRYEDFVDNPGASVGAVLDFLELSGPAPFIDDDTVELGTNHTLAGNPNRFRTGPVRIAEDDEWMSRLARRDQVSISALALPLLLRYGYPVRPGTRGSTT